MVCVPAAAGRFCHRPLPKPVERNRLKTSRRILAGCCGRKGHAGRLVSIAESLMQPAELAEATQGTAQIRNFKANTAAGVTLCAL
jgi:hypothetical protein